MRALWYTALSCCLIIAVFLSIGISPTVEETNARPSYTGTWSSVHPNSDSLTNANQCQLCHLNAGGGNGWNGYGWNIREQIVDQDLSISDAINALAAMDSDGNGTSNLNEINASAQPGWKQGATNSIYFKDGTVQTNQSAPSAISGLLDAGSATFPSPNSGLRLLLPLIEKAS